MKKFILDVVTYIASKILDTGLPRKNETLETTTEFT